MNILLTIILQIFHVNLRQLPRLTTYNILNEMINICVQRVLNTVKKHEI